MRAWSFAFALAMTSQTVHAQEVIALVDADCGESFFPSATLRERLAIELIDGGATLAGDELPIRIDATVTSRCASDALDVVRLSIARAESTHERDVVLEGGDADARARIVALAIAELVLATRPRATPEVVPAEAELAVPVSPDPEPPPEPPVVAPEPEALGWSVQIVASLGGVSLPLVATWLASLRAGARFTSPRTMPWAIELTVRGATGLGQTTRWGDSQADALTLALAGLAMEHVGSIDIGGGIELDAGAGWASGHLRGGERVTFVDPVVLASARGSLLARISRELALSVDVRVGWVLVGDELRTSDAAFAGVSGPSIALDLGVVIDP